LIFLISLGDNFRRDEYSTRTGFAPGGNPAGPPDEPAPPLGFGSGAGPDD
jgi:hypothetical protein